MLASIRRHLGMPLLAKELTEQAARRRTYVIRFLYAALLFASGLFIVATALLTVWAVAVLCLAVPAA